MEGYKLQGVGKDRASGICDIMIRRQLCKVTDIRTISEIMAEKGPKTTKLMKNLTNIIEVKKRRLEAMESKYMETRDTISKLVAEYDEFHQAYYEEIKKMQFSIREHFQWICNDQELMNLKLEKQEKELELRSIELHKREIINENKRKKLAKEIEENAAENSSLDEQRKANKRMMKLADDHKKEKEKLQEKIFFLENQLNEKQALEADTEQTKGSLDHIKRIRDDEGVYRKIENIHWNLKEKEEEFEDLKCLNQVLVIKERRSNEELQETREELIKGLTDLPKTRHIGVKRMGELEIKPFYEAIIAMKWLYNEAEAKNLASKLCAVWQEYLLDPNWYPFKVITCNDIPQGIIVENEEKLENLRYLGEEVYIAVMTAWEEIDNYYNSSGRYVPAEELWNFTESRKATLKEGVSCILKMWDIAQKHRRIT